MKADIEVAASAAADGEPGRHRLRRGAAEKLRILEAAEAPGASVARVARAHGVNANQVYYWRRQLRAGLLGPPDPSLLPVRIAAEPRRKRRISPAAASGAIELELNQGKLRVEPGADAGLLRLLLGYLLA